MFDVPTGVETVIGDHEKPIKCVVHNPVDSIAFILSFIFIYFLFLILFFSVFKYKIVQNGVTLGEMMNTNQFFFRFIVHRKLGLHSEIMGLTRSQISESVSPIR